MNYFNYSYFNCDHHPTIKASSRSIYIHLQTTQKQVKHGRSVIKSFLFESPVHSPVKTSPTAEFLTNIYYNNKKPAHASSHFGDNHYEISPAISTHFNSEDSRKPGSSSAPYFDMSPDAIRNVMKNQFGRPYSNDPAIEIIPSSQFFREKGNMRDIAAVIKPPEIPDALVKAALPPHIASVPQLSYPTQQLIQVRLQ